MILLNLFPKKYLSIKENVFHVAKLFVCQYYFVCRYNAIYSTLKILKIVLKKLYVIINLSLRCFKILTNEKQDDLYIIAYLTTQIDSYSLFFTISA